MKGISKKPPTVQLSLIAAFGNLRSSSVDALEQYRQTGDFRILMELDTVPAQEFSQPAIKVNRYIWSNAHHSLDFTCYQHAMAWILDNHHPGVVAYIASEFPANPWQADNLFTTILNGMLRAVNKRTFGYYKLNRRRGGIFKAVEKLEALIIAGGYAMVLDDMHGEVYYFEEEQGEQALMLVEQGEHLPRRLWEKGKAREWVESGEGEAVCSNTRMLEQDIRHHDLGVCRPMTKFITREQLYDTFLRRDLRVIVRREAKKYAQVR
jgi:hypothetical protein